VVLSSSVGSFGPVECRHVRWGVVVVLRLVSFGKVVALGIVRGVQLRTVVVSGTML
jgi:hypothetical protein